MSEFQILTVRKVPDREGQERVRVPVLQDMVLANGETVQVHVGGSYKLVNPNTPGVDHEAWPLLGVTVDEPPQYTTMGMRWVDEAVREGWMRRIGERPVPRPGGPPQAPWALAHVFIHADRIVINDVYNGEVSYTVTRQPDKFYTDSAGNRHPIEEYGMLDDAELATAEVAWFYELELESVGGSNG